MKENRGRSNKPLKVGQNREIIMNRFSISTVAAVAISGVLAIPAAQAAEVTLKRHIRMAKELSDGRKRLLALH